MAAAGDVAVQWQQPLMLIQDMVQHTEPHGLKNAMK